MTVEQTASTINTVTINVSGITDGARSTYIGISDGKMYEDDGWWLTLRDAKDHGYIFNYEVQSTASANGYIIVTMDDDYLDYKVIQFKVVHIKTDGTEETVIFPAVLGFEYERSKTKRRDSEIDITVKDMREINLFGACMYSCITGEYVWANTLDGVYSGDPIYADYLAEPVSRMLEVVGYFASLGSKLTAKDLLLLNDVVTYCVSDAEFKADWFNWVSHVINNCHLKLTETIEHEFD